MDFTDRNNHLPRLIKLNQPLFSRRLFMAGTAAGLSAMWIPKPTHAAWKGPDPENLRRFNGISPAVIKLSENYSNPSIGGPPMSEQLVNLVDHIYTEDEARIVQYLSPWASKSAKYLARKSGFPLTETQKILDNIVTNKSTLLTHGEDKDSMTYNITPLAGSIFQVLYRYPESDYTEWHREYSRRMLELYDTGFLTEYWREPRSYGSQYMRYIPVYDTIRENPSAYPSDKLYEILDRYQDLAVGLCACTTIAKVDDSCCGRPHLTCMAMGESARYQLHKGFAKKIDKKEAIEIKLEAEHAGLSTWMSNVDNMEANMSCSCCGCCCLILGSLTRFNMPGVVAPPHFMPVIDQEKCVRCGNCAEICNPKAHIVTETNHEFDPLRCIGCGLCAANCENKALTMTEVEKYKPPYKSENQMLFERLPYTLANVSKIKAERRKKK